MSVNAPEPQETAPLSVQERCLRAVREALERALTNVHGFEQTMLREAIRRAFPRLEARIRSASTEEIAEEIQYIRNKLDEILPPPNRQPGKRAGQRANKRPQKRSGTTQRVQSRARSKQPAKSRG
ncbi:hypothetical protein AAC03nite_11510 [Alicyclobacillus acidoterrestris]|uniref:hypothetical protein n=1 Tax=Alicyclobacillus suci TaxID=2816080 RepID=UPI0011927F12|nr:hypothetical protein [Alicyclobacillus suci]GEO25366.1 hypothetical protein AAC03nite_11510 [Alicyclobacillus acidoterrestris]